MLVGYQLRWRHRSEVLYGQRKYVYSVQYRTRLERTQSRNVGSYARTRTSKQTKKTDVDAAADTDATIDPPTRVVTYKFRHAYPRLPHPTRPHPGSRPKPNRRPVGVITHHCSFLCSHSSHLWSELHVSFLVTHSVRHVRSTAFGYASSFSALHCIRDACIDLSCRGERVNQAGLHINQYSVLDCSDCSDGCLTAGGIRICNAPTPAVRYVAVG